MTGLVATNVGGLCGPAQRNTNIMYNLDLSSVTHPESENRDQASKGAREALACCVLPNQNPPSKEFLLFLTETQVKG